MPALRLITIAPELPGGLDAIARLTSAGVVVSLGHSDATFEQAQAAVAAGARMFTHLFNAMRPLHHREPGLVGKALLPGPAYAAVIPDGVHLDTRVLELVVRLRGAGGVILTTDRVGTDQMADSLDLPAQASSPLSRAIAGEGAARMPGGGLAGGTITMLDGIRTVALELDAGVADAAAMASTNPANLLGLRDRGRLTAGYRADLMVLDADLRLKAVFVGGEEIA